MEKIHVQNLFLFRECLIVTLEVSRYDLGALQVERLQYFIRELAKGDITSPVPIPAAIREDLHQCLQYFKKSRTWRWIRNDFHGVIYDLERCLDDNNE